MPIKQKGILMNILIFLLVGLVAGWLAGMLLGGRYGILGSIIMGIVGAFVGGVALDLADVVIATSSPFFNAVITATIGALIVILIGRAVTEPDAV